MRKLPHKRLSPQKREELKRLELLGGASAAVFVGVIALAFAITATMPQFAASPQVAAVVSAVLVNLANQDRAENALPALTRSSVLTAAAQAKADDMASKGYFAHASPDGHDPWYWFAAAGYSFDYAGENLAVDFTDSAQVNTAWMNSPEHRANLLDPHFTEVGIATAVGTYQGRKAIFVVQEFGTPKSAPMAAAPQKTVSSVPDNPTALATAKPAAKTSPRVLGSAAKASPAATSAPAAVAQPAAASLPLTTSPVHLPWWAFLAASPRQALVLTYYVLSALVIAALAYTTRFELQRHHLRHVASATALISLMAIFFAAANYFVFVSPVLAVQ